MAMNTEHIYEVDLNWTDGRKGILYSVELNDEVIVATPPQFPKGVPGIWSPEHLFVAAINSCLMTTFLSIAENSKLEFSHFTSKAQGKLAMVDGKYSITEVTLLPRITISKNEDFDKAMRTLHRSEKACLISNSVNSKIIMLPEVIIAEEVLTSPGNNA